MLPYLLTLPNLDTFIMLLWSSVSSRAFFALSPLRRPFASFCSSYLTSTLLTPILLNLLCFFLRISAKMLFCSLYFYRSPLMMEL